MKKNTLVKNAGFLLGALLLNVASAQPAANKPLVLVAMAPIYSLTAPLLQGTDVELKLVPDEARAMQSQATVFTRQADRFADLFKRADAVISIGKLWTGDPLYIAVREVNIRAVEIDASKPWSHELDGVAVTNSPATGTVSPYFWLSPSNVVRVLTIVANDLERLYPKQAARIAANLEAQKTDYLNMKGEFEQRFITIGDPVLYSLSDQFIYLTSDLGVFVDDYFVKQDIDWKPEDYPALTKALKQNDVRIVLHQWDPSDEIKQAITAAGAKLLVLDSLETTTDFHAGLKQDLDALLAAFQPKAGK